MNVIINDGYTSVSCCFSWQEGGRDFPCSKIGWICEAKLCTQVNLTIHTACHIFILMHHLKGASFLYILQRCPCCILFPPSDEVRLYTSTSHICDSMWRHFIHTRRYVRTKFTMGYFSIIDMYIRESAEETISIYELMHRAGKCTAIETVLDTLVQTLHSYVQD